MSPSHRLPFPLLPQIRWGEEIARQVARRYGFLPSSQETDDLLSVSRVSVTVRYRLTGAQGFQLEAVPAGGDPEGAFRGWAFPWVKSDCAREAKRLRNGGTYHTCRPENEPAPIVVLGDDADAQEAKLWAEELAIEEKSRSHHESRDLACRCRTFQGDRCGTYQRADEAPKVLLFWLQKFRKSPPP